MENKPELIKGDEFPVCSCGCATYVYNVGPVYSFRSWEAPIITDVGCFDGVQLGNWRCAGCGMTSLVVMGRGAGGETLAWWMLPIGKDISGE
jgi:hypothetical protein